MKKNLLMSILLLAFATSCSVFMAAKKEGVEWNQLQSCRTRGQMLATGATIVSSERLPSGELVETYQVMKARGSAARALMHGALDVSTFGLWEVLGTPIEACVDKKEYISLKVYYDSNENVTRVELL